MKESQYPSAEVAKRLIELEKEHLWTSLNNIKELELEVFEDGLRWLLLEKSDLNYLVKTRLPRSLINQISEELILKYPLPTLDEKINDKTRKRSNFFHDVVLVVLERLYEIEGDKIIRQHFGPNYLSTVFKTFGKIRVIK